MNENDEWWNLALFSSWALTHYSLLITITYKVILVISQVDVSQYPVHVSVDLQFQVNINIAIYVGFYG